MIGFKLVTVTLPGRVRMFGQDSLPLVAGVLPSSLAFLLTDLISDLGHSRADAVVRAGFLVSLYILIILRVGALVPPFGTEARPAEEIQALFEGLFGQSSRTIRGTMMAYLVAQLYDVRAFHFWKRVTSSRASDSGPFRTSGRTCRRLTSDRTPWATRVSRRPSPHQRCASS